MFQVFQCFLKHLKQMKHLMHLMGEHLPFREVRPYPLFPGQFAEAVRTYLFGKSVRLPSPSAATYLFGKPPATRQVCHPTPYLSEAREPHAFSRRPGKAPRSLFVPPV